MGSVTHQLKYDAVLKVRGVQRAQAIGKSLGHRREGAVVLEGLALLDLSQFGKRVAGSNMVGGILAARRLDDAERGDDVSQAGSDLVRALTTGSVAVLNDDDVGAAQGGCIIVGLAVSGP